MKIIENKSTRLKSLLVGSNSSVITFCIATPENPMGVEQSSKEKKQSRESFEKELKQNHLIFVKVKGCYYSIENSYFILNPHITWCKKVLGRDGYNQESFIFGRNKGKEGLYFDLYFRKSESSEFTLQETSVSKSILDGDKNLFTQFKNFKFNINFSFFNEAIPETNRILEEIILNRPFPLAKENYVKILRDLRLDESYYTYKKVYNTYQWLNTNSFSAL